MRAIDGKADNILAVQGRKCSGLCGRIANLGNIDEADGTSRRKGQAPFGKLGNRSRRRRGRQRLFPSLHVAASAGTIELVFRDRLADGTGRERQGLKPVGIKFDMDFPLGAADPLDTPDAGKTLKVTRHHVVDKPGKLRDRHVLASNRIGHSRLRFFLDSLNDRLVDRARKVAPDPRNGVADIRHRAIRGNESEFEFHRRDRAPLANRGGELLDRRKRCDCILDQPRHFRLELDCGRSGLFHGHLDRRRDDRREIGNRQFHETVEAGDRQYDEEQDRRERIADRPGRNIGVHRAVSIALIANDAAR